MLNTQFDHGASASFRFCSKAIYNWQWAAGSTLSVYYKKAMWKKNTAVRTSTLEHRPYHTHTLDMQFIVCMRTCWVGDDSPRPVPVQKQKKLGGWVMNTRLHSSVQLQHCYKSCGQVSLSSTQCCSFLLQRQFPWVQYSSPVLKSSTLVQYSSPVLKSSTQVQYSSPVL